MLKALASLLKQRLRSSDVIGRTGGEEFAVALAGVDAETAVGIMEGIRVAFSKIRHLREKGEFTCTLRCGIAIFPEFGDATALADAADRVLYKAKDARRNRIVLADG